MYNRTIFFLIISIIFISLSLLSFTYKEPFSKHIQSYLYKQHINADPSSQIIIIDIDTQSLHKLGQWPFSRDVMARVIQNLADSGVGIIGVDIVFSSVDRLSPKNFASKLGLKGDFYDSDQVLADVIASTPTILGYFFDFEKNSSIEPPKIPVKFLSNKGAGFDSVLEAKGVDNNIPLLGSNSYSSGFFNVIENTESYIDKIPLIIKYKENYYPSLGFEMLRIAYGVDTIGLDYKNQSLRGVYLDDLYIPTDTKSQVSLNYRGKGFSYKYLSFVDIYNNDFNQSDVEGKFALIGTSDYGLNDRINTLYDRQMPGVEVHATLIDNILNQDFLYIPWYAKSLEVILIFVLSLVFASLLVRANLFFIFLITIFVLFLLLFFQYKMMFIYGELIDTFYPILALILSLLVLSLSRFYDESMQKKLIKDKFSKKVSKAVVEEILKSSDQNFDGVKKTVSIFFSDIRGFTTLSEQIDDSKRLIKILNLYMQPMIDDIIEHEGTVDKMIGDAIMAYWNAPLEQENHATLAVRSALSQLEKLKELNLTLEEEFGITLKIGIGIHTGECVVAQMGSTERNDYTIIGDSVNLASRIESLTKEYKEELLISEATLNALNGAYKAKLIDVVKVRGKSKEVAIYKVLV